MPLRRLHDALVSLSHVERRLEPFFREAADAVLREPLAAILQVLINAQRKNEGLALAEERPIPDEEAHLAAIISLMHDQMAGRFKPGGFERGGNTKTHGVVRAEFTVLDGLAANLRKGVFAEPRTYRAWVRFSGPGPDVPTDIKDVGFASMAIKLMGVDGPKLMDEEKATQDFICVMTPTFVTPDTRCNAVLQKWSLDNTPLWYFLDPRDSHLLDFLMQGLWNATQYNPLAQTYYSCVPYLLGEGQAMKYAFLPRNRVNKKIPGVPFGKVPDNYLRDNMAGTLAEQDVEFDICVQVQTDAHRMPIENAGVRWPLSLSPHVPVARLRIPRQVFASPAQMNFAKVLKWNPWHSLPEHRPLGNQSRARRRMYDELGKYRQQMNGVQHVEPTGDEVFG